TLKECYRHLKRMNFAANKIQHYFPISEEIILSFSEDDISFIDQFVYRFTKLQDSIGNKLFKNLLLFLDEDVLNISAIDIFHRLEQLNIISDYEKWKELRILRNEIAHDYVEDDAETAAKLNALLQKKTKLEKYLSDIITFLNNRGFNLS
ncbi:MAG: hypothetical protein AB1394_16495, partial [Bacteroidota bacterium]